jgi:hypothetical protein
MTEMKKQIRFANIVLFMLIVLAPYYSKSQNLERFNQGWNYGFREKATKKIIIPAKYTAAVDFVDGIAAVTESVIGSTNMATSAKWKLINVKGNIISDNEFEIVNLKKGGFAIVYKLDMTDERPNGYVMGKPYYKVGVILKSGKFVYPCELDDISQISGGYYKLFSKQDGVGIMDAKASITIKPQSLFNIKEYIGCNLFSYINPDENRSVLVMNGLVGGVIDIKLNIIINQDSINFRPSFILNQESCGNKSMLFGVTGGKTTEKGIYRMGGGLLVVPIKWSLSDSQGGRNSQFAKIKPNIIEIHETIRDKLLAKYDWNGKVLFRSE